MSPEIQIQQPIRVLHIDDDSSFLDLSQTYLERELPAATVVTADTPQAGLDELDRNFDCVVSDYDMPKMDGLELFETVNERQPRLPFVLYTGKGSEEIASKALNVGVTGYFQKGGPDQYQRLANRIEHATNEYRTERESERYSTVLQALGYPIYVVNERANFEYVNDAFVELTGYDRKEIIGASPGLMKSDEGVEQADEMLAQIVSTTGPDSKQFSVDIYTNDGEVIPCHDHMAALPFEDDFRGSVGILQDVSEHKQQRRELSRQNERLEEFVSIISHDLRSPLHMAQTATQLADETNEAAYFEKVTAAHDRMEQMITELVTLAQTGRSVTQRDCLSLSTLAEEAGRTVTTDMTLQIESEAAVEGEAGRMRRLFENIIANADTHAGPDVTVTVGVLTELDDRERRREGFYIEDDGPGIPFDDHERVFEPSVTTDDDGTGLGLAIVRRIAEAHGWTVTAEDSAHGGARFVFSHVELYPRQRATA
ncbi:MAG: PAS sensor histidine kinase [Haloquadratum sp. J07HQX50]|nr:MAG: PAS sensor histidine kinase [Haloquadratum sp. J07HQX50]